jgi:hypothetical protein
VKLRHHYGHQYSTHALTTGYPANRQPRIKHRVSLLYWQRLLFVFSGHATSAACPSFHLNQIDLDGIRLSFCNYWLVYSSATAEVLLLGTEYAPTSQLVARPINDYRILESCKAIRCFLKTQFVYRCFATGSLVFPPVLRGRFFNCTVLPRLNSSRNGT